MKDEIRVLGIDDSPFDKFDSLDKEVLVVGTVFRGGKFMDGLVSTEVEKDGDDATVKLIEMINDSKFKKQLQAIFLDGIALGGFNVVNINVLHEKTGIPVIAVVRGEPDVESFKNALKKLRMEHKVKLVEQLPKPEKVDGVYMQRAGIDKKKALQLLEKCSPRSDVPEAIRVAHMIAGGVVNGQSTGQA